MKTILHILVVALFAINLQAQEKTISGIITESSGIPLPGVNVIVKNTSNGAQSDFDGLYSLQAFVGQTLVFSYVGYITVEKQITASGTTINIQMEEDTSVLEEVVVTAMGTRKEKKALGYSVSSVSSESISRKLSGKSAGVLVKKDNPQSGLLTAGEINDLEKWDEWLKLQKENEFNEFQDKWGFYLKNKIEVTILDKNGDKVNNVKVKLYNENKKVIMTGRTDVYGRITMFRGWENTCNGDPFLIQIYGGNKIFGKKIDAKTTNVSFVLDDTSISNDIDIMFTIDATGSMGDEINYLKSELKNIITRLDKGIQQKRVALTFYRDQGDEYLVRDFDFNYNINEVKENLSNQFAMGGGDYEEAVEQALIASMAKSWNENAKSKLLFLLLDAPPHFTEKNVEIIKTQIKLAQEKGIKIIPIVASGANKDVEFLMRFFSVSTNGTYVFLTDDSGIGNTHLKPSTSDFKVEKLNDLIVRLIEYYSGIDS